MVATSAPAITRLATRANGHPNLAVWHIPAVTLCESRAGNR